MHIHEPLLSNIMTIEFESEDVLMIDKCDMYVVQKHFMQHYTLGHWEHFRVWSGFVL